MLIEYAVELDNRGIIGGGGGGGAGGRLLSFATTTYYGGGGGAGRRIAPGGFISTQTPFANGADGTVLAGGIGGAFVIPNDSGDFRLQLGGDGGGLGEPGEAAAGSYTDSLPGAAGRAIVGDANITYITVGDIRGAVV